MSDFESDSDDSFLERHMDQYISSKPTISSSKEPVKEEFEHSSEDSSDDSYLENYINQMDSKKEHSRLKGTTVTQDYDNLPEVYQPTTKLFSNYGLSSDDDEETNSNDKHATRYSYDDFSTPECAELPVPFNSTTIDTLIYPTNYPVRDYQRKIVETCIKNNTLVAIPTGTGKTFIAATIMLNFFRWFCLKDGQPDMIPLETTHVTKVKPIVEQKPIVKKKKSIKDVLSDHGTFEIPDTGPTTKAKIIFVAPTRPLVAQIIQACLGITGIPPEHMCILLDKKPKERGPLYQKNSIFIGTPQIIEKDLYNGTLSPHDIKLLIIDECHKSTGNFSYVKIVSYINRFCKNNFRIIGLSATPTNTVEGLENIVENLQVSKIELRTEESPDLKKYMMKKEVTESVVIPTENKFIAEIIDCLSPCVLPILKEAIQMGIYPSVPKPAYINSFIAMENKRKVVDNASLSEGLKWYQFFLLNVLFDFGFLMQKLNHFGIRTFYHCLQYKKTEFDSKFKVGKTKNKHLILFYNHENINVCLESCKEYLFKEVGGKEVENFEVSTHPKFDKMLQELYSFFEDEQNTDSRVIIFSSFRDVALEIVQTIDGQNDVSSQPERLKPHIFIGQSAGKKAFDPEQFVLENSTKSNSGMTKKQREMRLKQIEDVKKAEKEIMKENGNKSRIFSSEMAQNTGMSQVQQKEVIENFKSGKHNILVCTSIGEEGLDIGEVDLIIFFDATASLVRNIQRMGRTGRKRDGKVFLILTKREMDKFNKSFQEYEHLQQEIQDYGDSFMKYSCNMYPQNRHYQIVYDKICIANENEDIVNVDDADRVIALGTQMTQARRTGINKGRNKGRATKKAPKTFNYPNNVDPNKPPGFSTVGNMLKKIIKKDVTKENHTRAKKTVSFQENAPPKKFQKVVPGSYKKASIPETTETFVDLSD